MQARLRAQLGDRPKCSGERRRRSVVVAINSLDHNRPSTRLIVSLAQSPSCAHSLLWCFIRLHGVNHNQPFPTATSLHKIFTSFTLFIVFQCFRRRHVPTLWCCHFGCLRGRLGEKRRTSAVCGGAPRYGGDVLLIFDIFCAVLRAGCSSSVRRWSSDLRRLELG